MRDQILEAVEQARIRREDLGRGQEDRSEFHLREYLLVVQHVLDGGLLGHAAADVSGGWTEDPGLLHASARAPRKAAKGVGDVSAVPVLGSGHDDRLHALDRGGGDSDRSMASSDAVAGVSAAPGLWAAEVRAGSREDQEGSSRS